MTSAQLPIRVVSQLPISGSRPIRVLSIARHAVGGIRTYLKYTYRALPFGRYDFTLLAPESIESSYLRADLGSDIRVVEVRHDRAVARLLAAAARELASGSYDVIHSHGFTAGAIAAFVSAPYAIPHVLTCHDVFRVDQFTSRFGRVRRRILERLVARADVIQCPTEDARANVLSYLPLVGRRARVRVVLHGIPVDRFRGIAVSRCRPAGSPCVFGFLGRMVPQKGFDVLIDAVELLARRWSGDRFEVRVISDGGFVRELRAAVETRQLDRYFRFTGFTREVTTVLGEIDCVLMPSRWEACGLLAMEALAAGCPLIASSCPGLREVISGTPALRVQPGDPISLASAMITVMRDIHRSLAAAAAYVAEASSRFDIRRAASELDALLRLALAREGRLTHDDAGPAGGFTSSSPRRHGPSDLE